MPPSEWIPQTQLILNSYRRLLGRELIDRSASPEVDAKRLFEAPVVVVSHGTQADPILNYGNRAALELWEMDIETLLATPSRETAERVHRDERARLLAETAAKGYIENYAGIRVSSSGKRFRILAATVWSLTDESGIPRGQAAAFRDWEPL